MISKEKLLNGYIKNDIKTGGELFKKWKEACLYYEFSYEWMTSGNIETNLEYTEGCYIDRFEDFNGCGEIGAFLAVNPDYEELTLEDFEEGSKEESSSENTKYRYEVVDISPAEIYSAMLNGETFYVNEKEMYWNGNAFWCDCERVRFIEDTHEVCRKVEVTWQDEVLDYLKKPSNEGFEDELPSKFRVDYMDSSFHLVDSEFLEMCRVALRATGELK